MALAKYQTVNPQTKQFQPCLSKYDEMFEDVCNQISSGKSIKRIAQENSNFTPDGWYYYLHQQIEISNLGKEEEKDRAAVRLKRYAQARDSCADSHFDNIVDMADKVVNGSLGYNEGRVAIDAMKFTASRLKPKQYGERLEQTVTVQVDLIPILEKGRQRILKQSQDNIIEHDSINKG